MKIADILRTSTLSSKFKMQLIASFVLINLIIMATGFLSIYIIITDMYMKQNEAAALQMFRKDENNINSILNEVSKLSKLIIISDAYQDIVKDEFSSEEDFIEARVKVFNIFSDIIESYDYIDSIVSYGEKGTQLASNARYNDYEVDRQKTSLFYQSEIYNEIRKKHYNLQWSGKHKNDFFDITHSRKQGTARNVITAARMIRIPDRSRDGASLVINILESRLASVYTYNGEESSGTMFIVDRSGLIISHGSKEFVGQTCEYSQKLAGENQTGTFTVGEGSDAKQVVYYRLNNTGWTIINEIPMKTFMQYSITIRNNIMLIFVICLTLVFSLSLYWIYRLTRPLNSLITAMRKMEGGDLDVKLDGMPKNELGLLSRQFNKMARSISELLEKNAQMANEKRELEMEALQRQINPHFLFNTLNVIRWMAVVANNINIEESLTTLGKILNPIFRDNAQFWPVREEIEYTGNYIKIINLRYGENISFRFEIPEELLDYSVMRFILQPLIENSFTYGLGEKRIKINIIISARSEQGDILISVTDNGIGIEAEKLKKINDELKEPVASHKDGTGIGIANVHRRIRLNYGETYGLSVFSAYGKGTEVIIRIPAVKKS